MIKKLLTVLIFTTALNAARAQQSAYTLPLPQGWAQEKIALPIDFAPAIPITGIEELRFTPGWSKSSGDEYWSYTFLWFINGTPKYKSDTLQSYLTQYFNGLYLTNLKDKTNAPVNFSKTEVKKIKASVNDEQTFEGTIITLNFLTKKEIKFYARIHVRNFSSINHSALLFEISPQEYKQPVWDKLDGIVNGFKLN